MNDFNLPIIKGEKMEKRILSMDEYLKFVEFNIKHAFDKKAYDKQKKINAVDVRFSM